MPARLRQLPSILLGQLPTVLSLAVLALIGWWGYVWDWKIPSLPDLLHPSAAKKAGEPKKEENEAKKTQGSDKPLPPITLASEDMVKAAGIEEGTVEQRLIDEYVKAHGHVEFNQDHYAHLSTRASGTAWRVLKRAGDEVDKDDVLALIASPEVAKLKFDLQQTLLTVLTREKIYQRKKNAGTSTAPLELENAEASLREARILLSNGQQALQNLGFMLDTQELSQLSDEQVTARLRTLGIPDSLLQQLDQRTLTNNLLPMYAPFKGVVIKRDIVKGEVVNPTTPQFVLADLTRLWIMLHVRLEDAGKLKIGQEMTFRLDGSNEDTPPGQLRWISAEVDEKTRTVAARAEVPNENGQLRPGTFGDGSILVHRVKRLIVPNDAVQFDGKSHFVFLQGTSAREFQPVPVELGPQFEKFTVVLSGLQVGQRIVITKSGSHALLSEMLKERIGGED
jgi:cobalt-zinc-cadmium efflux system membrane fusion protein